MYSKQQAAFSEEQAAFLFMPYRKKTGAGLQIEGSRMQASDSLCCFLKQDTLSSA